MKQIKPDKLEHSANHACKFPHKQMKPVKFACSFKFSDLTNLWAYSSHNLYNLII
jgi:hypothetical protein